MFEIAIVTLAIILGAFLLGTHVASALGITAIVLLLVFADRPALQPLGNVVWSTTSDWVLLTLPLFVLMGELLIASGVIKELYAAISGWFVRVPGGLVQTNIAASTVFAGVCGSSVAATATIGGVALPEQGAQGYSKRLALGSIAAGGTLGALLPPSTVMIIYAVSVQVSIGDLFLAGIVPGLLVATLLSGVIAGWALLRPSAAPRPSRVAFSQLMRGSVGAFPVILLLLVVLGSIYLGIATPTESAAFGAVGAMIIVAMKKKLTLAVLREVFRRTASTTGFVMLLLVAAFCLQFAIGYLGVPRAISVAVTDSGWPIEALIVAFMALFLILGFVFDDLAVMVTTVPIIGPVLAGAGVDMIWFGVIMTMLVCAGLISPGYGMNLFVIHGVQRRLGWDTTIKDVFLGVTPFFIAILFAVALVFFLPQLATWLPSIAHVQ